MKTFTYILFSALVMLGVVACEEGIDPITEIAPGADTQAPEVTIKYPSEGTLIRVKEDLGTIKIQLEVTDDIEIGNVVVALDNKELAKFSNFKDYRHTIEEYLYENLTNGSHTLAVTATDLSGKTTVASVNFEKAEPYKPVYSGEFFYMPFDGDHMDLVSILEATAIGSSGFSSTGKIGSAYAGAPDSYLTFRTENLVSALGQEFSAAFWYKLDASPDRAGILMISSTVAGANDDDERKTGLRFFREGSAASQTFKLNVGSGDQESWFDGGANASLSPSANWAHIAFTISPTECAVYLNGINVSKGSFTGISWAGCDVISVASGAPRFTEWSHLSDNSLIDELRFFNKALTQKEIQSLINGD